MVGPMKTKRVLVIALVAAVVLAGAAAGGAYLYFFSGARTSPKPLALASATTKPSSATTPQSSATAVAGELTGHWTVGQGSLAGYRVKEQFVGESSTHDAVARTSAVTGALTVEQSTSGLQVSNMTFTAQLANLQSVDQVAGRDVSLRDGIVRRSLDVTSFPQATFLADSIAVPSTLQSGSTVPLTVPGKITIHGTSRDVQASVQARLVGGQVQIAGSIPMVMTDFGIQPPQIAFTSVQPQVTVEFQLVLTKAS
jgi:polyisoprenoid-binding protein YceI